ncbi:hypothetical protein DIE06_01525 [Burkholderia sp. Bp8998]|nr:hypothetical protein DIE06_01525 [Burkholderia sp. Bp8998]
MRCKTLASNVSGPDSDATESERWKGKSRAATRSAAERTHGAPPVEPGWRSKAAVRSRPARVTGYPRACCADTSCRSRSRSTMCSISS